MRALIQIALSLGVLTASTLSASGVQIEIVDNHGATHDVLSVQPVERPWTWQRPSSNLVERPVADLLSAKLGLGEGKVELFRYRLEDAPSNATILDGVVDGAGIKLKLKW